MRRLWRIFWLVYCLSFSATMFAFAGSLIHVPKPLGISISIAMLVGGFIDWHVYRLEAKPTECHPARAGQW